MTFLAFNRADDIIFFSKFPMPGSAQAKDLLSLDEDHSWSSDEEEDGRSKAFNRTHQSESDSSAGEESEDEENLGSDSGSEDDGNDHELTGSKRKTKPLTPEEMEAKLRAIRKSGVVYLSRIPPYMKPIKLRQILSRFGEVNRIFLSPEDPAAHARRVKSGGNRKKKYTEGWAEFVRKSDAKLAADTLNGNKIGGKKGSFYYDDIMNIKYLKRFKWTDLTEQIALEAQERQEKLKAEIALATRENKIFIENVERKSMIDNIEKKKGTKQDTVRRTFTQREANPKKANAKDVSNVLSKVF